MPRHPAVSARTPISITVEGASDEAFVRFLQGCCDREGVSVHLSPSVAHGGDSLAVVEHAVRARSSARRQFSARVVLLDADRTEQDRQAKRDANRAAARAGLQLVYLRPNLEGLLLRLHPGHELRRVVARDAVQELRKIWPEYRKPPTAVQLRRRFALDALRRAARHDDELERLLQAVGVSTG